LIKILILYINRINKNSLSFAAVVVHWLAVFFISLRGQCARRVAMTQRMRVSCTQRAVTWECYDVRAMQSLPMYLPVCYLYKPRRSSSSSSAWCVGRFPPPPSYDVLNVKKAHYAYFW